MTPEPGRGDLASELLAAARAAKKLVARWNHRCDAFAALVDAGEAEDSGKAVRGLVKLKLAFDEFLEAVAAGGYAERERRLVAKAGKALRKALLLAKKAADAESAGAAVTIAIGFGEQMLVLIAKVIKQTRKDIASGDDED